MKVEIAFTAHPESSLWFNLPFPNYAARQDAIGQLASLSASQEDVALLCVKTIQCPIYGLEKYAVGPVDFSLSLLHSLAERLSAMTGDDVAKLTGALDIGIVDSLADVLALSERLESYAFYKNADTEKQLGIYIIENGMEDFPESVIPYLDFARIGAGFYADHSCAFVTGGLVVALDRQTQTLPPAKVAASTPTPTRQAQPARITTPYEFTATLSPRESNPWIGNPSLDLPAKAEELKDAFDQARVSENGYRIESCYCQREFLQSLIPKAPDLYELNYLAERLATFDEIEMTYYEALVRLERDPPDLATLINLTFNTDKCVMVGTDTLHGLGEFAADSCIYPEFDVLSDEMIQLLNFTEIGERFKRENKGVSVDGRYVFNLASANEMAYPYAGDPPTPELDPAHSIWLRVQSTHTPDVFVELALPADKATLLMTAKEIGRDSLRGAAFFCSRCVVPHFRCALNGDEPIDVLNAAAEKLLQIQKGGELPKLKAAMEHTNCMKLADLLPLMAALDSFTFLPGITNPSDYGEKTMLDECGLDSAHPAMRHFNFTAYGMERLCAQDASITSYGLVRRLEPAQELTAEERQSDQASGMGM